MAQSDSSGPKHYLFSAFTTGTVLMKNGKKSEVPLNYNGLTQEILFENQGKKLALNNKELDQVDTVFIEKRKFVMLDDKIVELLIHAKCDLFAEHKCRLNTSQTDGYGVSSQTSGAQTYNNLVSNGTIYNMKLPDGYNVSPYIWYWIRRNGDLQRFNSVRQLMKLYEGKDDVFKSFSKEHKVEINNQESITGLVKALEAN